MLDSKALICVLSCWLLTPLATAKQAPAPLELPVGELLTMLKTARLGQDCVVDMATLALVSGAATLNFAVHKGPTRVDATLSQAGSAAAAVWSIQKGLDTFAGVPYWRFRLVDNAVTQADQSQPDDVAGDVSNVRAWDWDVGGRGGQTAGFHLTVAGHGGSLPATVIDCSAR